MPKENSDPRKNFVPRFLPWLLGGAMFLVYWVTRNHWVNLLNVYQVAGVSGWVWHPQIFNPLSFLATLPFHLLPAARIAGALNVFSAFCAAATLAVLARSVAILPHDRTEMERTRERSDFSFLTGWVAWAPPIVAVIFAGLELGFWENATSFTNESLDLLLFAVILWQLLEYRLDEYEGRLLLAAFLYGAALTEDPAMVGFFPLFLMMIIWLRKLDFFNLNFIIGMTLSGLAGMLFFLVLPLTAKLSGYPLTIWDLLKPNLRGLWQVIKLVSVQDVRHDLALMSLTSLLPAFLMSIRWSAGFGDSSRLGAALVNYTIHVVNAILFGVLLWVTFNPPFGARALAQEIIPRASALPLYYVGALCIGYYCGYALLIFGQAPVPTRRNTRPDPALPPTLLWLCPVIVAGTLAVIVLFGGLLIYRNRAIVSAVNDDSLLKYAQFARQSLPYDRAILLCDSDDPNQDQPLRTFLLQAALARDGQAENFAVVDTKSLPWAAYHTYLHKSFPKVWPVTVATNALVLNPLQINFLLGQISKSNNLCYLNPSFGYYFEQFYQEPHGLIYALKPLPQDTLLPPVVGRGLIDENESIWAQVLQRSRPAIENALHPPDLRKKPGPVGWLMKHLHVLPEPNPNALMAGEIYSRSLDYLGVQVQRAGELNKAAGLFQEAIELNSNNVTAARNLAFNKTLADGSHPALNLASVSADQFGQYRTWNEVLSANGPFDEPSFCFELGSYFMGGGLLRQAAAEFHRVSQLLPDNLAARLFLGQFYVINRRPDQAMSYLQDPLDHPSRFALTDYNSTELHVLAAAVDFQKSENDAAVALLEKEMALHPDDETLMLVSAQVFNMRGYYTNALRAIDRKLARSPDDPAWLYGKGLLSIQVGAYANAVAALSRYLKIETNNPDGLYNRGYAYFRNGQLDAARADFLRLQAAYSNDFHIAYGLGEIAWRLHDTNQAIRNYRIFVANAPTNTIELNTVRERLAHLDGK